MNKYRNELEAYIYEYCIEDIQKAVWAYCAEAKEYGIIEELEDGDALIENMSLSSAECKYIDSALKITAQFLCPVMPKRKTHATKRLKKKTEDFCIEVNITTDLKGANDKKKISCYYVSDDIRAYNPPKPMQENIIPFIYTNKLDDEAEIFLKIYYPDALDCPMPIPVKEIASKLGLTLLQNYRLTEDFSIFGQICFEDMCVTVFNCENNKPQSLYVKTGTIFVDPDTFWQRNVGCVNNTIVHEIVHWYKHRWYPALCKLLDKKLEMAHRCPANMTRPNKDTKWTSIQSMEWQANKLAPRILMPVKTFRQKVEELYNRYSYSSNEDNDDKLKQIVQELGEFYGVSKQSVILRMKEVGYEEASDLTTFTSESQIQMSVSILDALQEYQKNEELVGLVDAGLFRYVDGYYIINDDKHLVKKEDGTWAMSEYTMNNLPTSVLQFIITPEEGTSKSILFKKKQTPQNQTEFSLELNDSVIKSAIAAHPKGNDYLQYLKKYAQKNLDRKKLSFWAYVDNLRQTEGWDKEQFLKKTGLNDAQFNNVIYKRSSMPAIRTIMAIACGFSLDLEDVERLMQLATRCFNLDLPEHLTYHFCITHMQGEPLEVWNELLRLCKLKVLGSGTYKEK